MKSSFGRKLAMPTLLAVAVVTGIALAGVRVPLDQVPARAVKAIKDRYRKAEIRFVDKEAKDRYEFALQEGERQFDVGVTAEGKLLGVKEEVAPEKLPIVIKEAVEKKFSGAKIVEAEKVTVGDGEAAKVTYEILVKAGNDTHSLVVDSKGKVIEPK